MGFPWTKNISDIFVILDIVIDIVLYYYKSEIWSRVQLKLKLTIFLAGYALEVL